jgi:hypothetical protein
MNIITPTKPKPEISADEMERRREALRQADASNRIEGLHRNPNGDAVYEAFIRGEIELNEIMPRIKALDLHR